MERRERAKRINAMHRRGLSLPFRRRARGLVAYDRFSRRIRRRFLPRINSDRDPRVGTIRRGWTARRPQNPFNTEPPARGPFSLATFSELADNAAVAAVSATPPFFSVVPAGLPVPVWPSDVNGFPQNASGRLTVLRELYLRVVFDICSALFHPGGFHRRR